MTEENEEEKKDEKEEKTEEPKEPKKKKSKLGKGCLILILLGVGFFVLVGLIGVSGGGEKKKEEVITQQEPEKVTEEVTEEEAVEEVEPKEETEPFKISGVGQKATEKFTLKEGLAVFKMIHSGSHNFIVWLLDSEGNKIEVLVNEIGPFDGSKAVKIPEDGVYLLDVNADGSWTVSIE